MATMVLEVYDALKEAGASEANARGAAEAVLHGDAARLDRVEGSLREVKAELAGMRREIDQLNGKVATLTWMVGLNITLVLLVLGKLFLVR